MKKLSQNKYDKRVNVETSHLFDIKFQRVCYDTNITMVSYSAFQTYDKYLIVEFQTYVKYLVLAFQTYVKYLQ